MHHAFLVIALPGHHPGAFFYGLNTHVVNSQKLHYEVFPPPMDSLDRLMKTDDFVQYRVHILPESHFETLDEGLETGEDPLATFIRVGNQMEALGTALQRLAYLCSNPEACVQLEPQEDGPVVIVVGGPRVLVHEWVLNEDIRGNLGDQNRMFIAIPDNDYARELWEGVEVPEIKNLPPKLRVILGGK